MHVFACVTAGSVNPAAIYVVRTFYTPTNNDVPIQYLHHSSHIFAAIHLFISSHDEIKDFCSMDKLMRRDIIGLTRAF